MKVIRIVCLAGAIALGVAGAALADPVTFTASGTFQDGATLSGTLVIDTGTGAVESNGLDLTVTGGQASGGITFTYLQSNIDFAPDASDNFYEIEVSEFSQLFSGGGPIGCPPTCALQVESPIVTLTIPLGTNTTLVGFTGGSGSLCTDPGNCENGAYYTSYQTGPDPVLTSGMLSGPASSTPEPASVLLLAIPSVWLLRRQRRNA